MSNTNTVTRIERDKQTAVDKFRCESCDSEFLYGPVGFPDYCPDCGEMFDFTKDAIPKKGKV